MNAHPTRDLTMQTSASTTELVRAAVLGDQHAWEAIVTRYAGLIWTVVRSYRLDMAEAADVTQTTWLRLVQHLERIREPETMDAWLVTTARKESLRALRRAGRKHPTYDSDTLETAQWPESSPKAPTPASEADHTLWRCIDELPEHCQQLLRMLIADPPIAYKQISATLDMPIDNIGPTRRRCLQHLRQLAEQAGALAE
jgi:RNA polymerase sigma factor (sigma-70 family)